MLQDTETSNYTAGLQLYGNLVIKCSDMIYCTARAAERPDEVSK